MRFGWFTVLLTTVTHLARGSRAEKGRTAGPADADEPQGNCGLETRLFFLERLERNGAADDDREGQRAEVAAIE
jgi:hypothetical protein